MILGVKNYEHDYIVQNNRIMYKDQDGVTDKISYGFKTIFAHMYEYDEKKSIT